jgi:hypothetical protein
MIRWLGQILIDLPGHVLLRHGDVLVQVRDGPMTHEVLGTYEAHLRHLGATTKGPVGFVVVVEPGADIPPADVRARQKAFIGHMLEKANARLVVVIEHSGVKGTVMRTIARLVAPGHRAVKITSTVTEACRLLAEHVPGTDRKALEADVAEARARTRDGHQAG